jgi:hypothetical protein
MAVSLPFRSWLQYQNNAFYYNDPGAPISLPDRTKFYGLLANYTSGTLADTSGKADVITSEIIKTTTNNYARFNAVFGSSSFFDAGNKRWQMPVASWTASFPEAIQYDSVILVADTVADTSLEVAITPGTPATFTTAVGHNLNNNDEIVITADPSGTLPTPLSINSIYYVYSVLDGLNFQISTLRSDVSGSVALDIASAGSQVRLRYAKGRLVGLRVEDSPVTLPANTPHSWSFYLSNAAYFGVGQGS